MKQPTQTRAGYSGFYGRAGTSGSSASHRYKLVKPRRFPFFYRQRVLGIPAIAPG